MKEKEALSHKQQIDRWIESNRGEQWGWHWKVEDSAFDKRGTRRIRFKFSIRKRPENLDGNEGFIPLQVNRRLQKDELPTGNAVLFAYPGKKSVNWTDVYPWEYRREPRPHGIGTLMHWIVKGYLSEHYPDHTLEHSSMVHERPWSNHLDKLGIKGNTPYSLDEYGPRIDERVVELIRKRKEMAFAF